jgi:AcrR family transcriptional regulator
MAPDERQTRDKILHTAFGLFLRQGYENTPIQAIIDAVGIAKGTFYHHYHSKEDMLVALVEGLSRRVVDVVEPVVNDPTLPAVEKLLAISRAAVARKAADFDPSVLLLVKQMRSRENRRLADAIDEILHRWVLPLYRSVIQEGVDQGVFHVRFPELAADLVVGFIGALKDKGTDLFLAAVEGRDSAMDELMALYQAIEEAVERILGAKPGSLPIYTSIDVRALIARMSSGGTA